MNCMERQIAERAERVEAALLADGRTNVICSLGSRLGALAVDGWPRDFTVYEVVILGEQISTTDPRFCAGDRIRKSVRIDHVGATLRAWAKKGRLVSSVQEPIDF